LRKHKSTDINRLIWVNAPVRGLNKIKTFIVSGGGIEFMRPWTERVYGVPPEQVVGSSIKTTFQMRDGRPELFCLPAVNGRPAPRRAR
jgi:hypothetical protein